MLNKTKTLTPKNFKSYKLIYDEEGNLLTDLELLYALKTWRSAVMKKYRLPSTCIFNAPFGSKPRKDIKIACKSF